MASSDFKKFARKYLKDFEKTAGEIKESRVKGAPKVTGRGKLEAQDFSIVVIDQKPTGEAIEQALGVTFENTTEKQRKDTITEILADLKRTLSELDIDSGGSKGTVGGKIWNDPNTSEKFKDKLRAQRNKAAKGKGEFAIIAGKFSGISDWKKKRGLDKNAYILQAIRRGIQKKLGKTITTEELATMGGSEKDPEGTQLGLQLEHGQSGGIGAGTVRVIEQEKRLERMSRSAKKKAFTKRPADARGLKKLKKAIEKYKVDIKINIERDQYMRAADLKLHAHYAPVITITSAASNQAAANAEEGAILAEFLKTLEELVALPGSATAGEMTRDAALYNLNGNGKGRTTKGPGKPRKSQKTKSKGGAKGKFIRKESFNTMYDKGHNLSTAALIAAVRKAKKKGRAAPRSGEAPRKSGSSRAPLHLIGIWNKRLPDVVKANMGEPRLTNQTGRFAESARITEMIMTPQGFPSVGYTYMRHPYETFEQNHDYDPRRLIDQSIREIAAAAAIGRFYTRRV